MLTEPQHARSEDEAQELEEVLRGPWWRQALAAVSLLVGAGLICFWMLLMMVAAGLASGCSATREVKHTRPAYKRLSFTDPEPAQPDSTYFTDSH